MKAIITISPNLSAVGVWDIQSYHIHDTDYLMCKFLREGKNIQENTKQKVLFFI